MNINGACTVIIVPDLVLPLEPRYKNDKEDPVVRKAMSAIYFLLNKEEYSAWHCLKSDEIWHYYDGGSPVEIYVIDTQGALRTYLLGNPRLIEEASFQVIIGAGKWFAARLQDQTSFALVGCTVSPGFEYNDFILADKDILISKYPQHIDIISSFSRKTKPETGAASDYLEF